jgi:hypothetical protein
MGADLYITALFDPTHAEWAPKFDAAVELRDSLPKGTAAYEQAQQQVEHCYDQMKSAVISATLTTAGTCFGNSDCHGGATSFQCWTSKAACQ